MTKGLLILCLLVGVSVIILPLGFWLDAKHGTSFIMSFEEFHECYRICPNDFILHKGWVRYFSSGVSYTTYAIGFGFISWIKYCLWRKIGLHIEKKKKLNEDYKNFIKCMTKMEDKI